MKRLAIGIAASLAVLSGAALAGEGEARIIAAPGDRATGIGTAELLPEDVLGIDAAGNVLFLASTDDEGVFENGWFLGNANSRSLVILKDTPLPGGGGVDVSGLDLTFANPLFLNQSGRLGIIGSSNALADLDAILTTSAPGSLRTIAAVLRALPGVCAYRPRSGTEAATDAIVHDDFAFIPANVGNEFGQSQPCSAQDDHGPTLIMRQGTNDAVQIAYNGLAVPLRPNTEFRWNFAPRGAFADGSLVFAATVDVPTSGTNRPGIFTYKPNVGLFTVAIRDEAAPGTGSTIDEFGPVRIVDGATNTFVEVVWAARLPSNDYVVYSTRENSGSAPIVQTGVTDGAYELVVGQQTPTGFEILPGPLGQLIIVGATTGPDLPFGKGVGVWRYDPLATPKMTLIAYDGMTFPDGGASIAVEEIQTVNVNASGRVALRVESSDPLVSRSESILIEDATGALRCALRSGDEVPERGGGTARVTQMGRPISGFPEVTSSGADGYSSLFGANGEMCVFLNGISGAARGVYVVSLGGGGPGPGPGPNDPNVRAGFRRGVLKLTSSRVVTNFDVRVQSDAVVVTGEDGTLINGSADPYRAEGVRKLIARLGRGGGSLNVTGDEDGACEDDCFPRLQAINVIGSQGDDSLSFTGLGVHVLNVSLGRSGTDAVNLRGIAATGPVKVAARRGTTSYDVRSLYADGRVSFRTGDSYDVTLLDSEIGGASSILCGRAGGDVTIERTNLEGRLTARAPRTLAGAQAEFGVSESCAKILELEATGSGEALIQIDHTKTESVLWRALASSGAVVDVDNVAVSGRMSVRSGRADDEFVFSSSSTDSIQFRTFVGDDTVRFAGFDLGRGGVVDLGGGNDRTVFVQDPWQPSAETVRRLSRRGLLRMGAGDDELEYDYPDVELDAGSLEQKLKLYRGGLGNDAAVVRFAEPLSAEDRKKLEVPSVLPAFEGRSFIELAKR